MGRSRSESSLGYNLVDTECPTDRYAPERRNEGLCRRFRPQSLEHTPSSRSGDSVPECTTGHSVSNQKTSIGIKKVYYGKSRSKSLLGYNLVDTECPTVRYAPERRNEGCVGGSDHSHWSTHRHLVPGLHPGTHEWTLCVHSSVIRHPSSVIRPPSSVLRPSSFV